MCSTPSIPKVEAPAPAAPPAEPAADVGGPVNPLTKNQDTRAQTASRQGRSSLRIDLGGTSNSTGLSITG